MDVRGTDCVVGGQMELARILLLWRSWVYFILFIRKDAFSRSDFVTSHDRMNNEMGGNGAGLISGTIPTLTWREIEREKPRTFLEFPVSFSRFEPGTSKI